MIRYRIKIREACDFANITIADLSRLIEVNQSRLFLLNKEASKTPIETILQQHKKHDISIDKLIDIDKGDKLLQTIKKIVEVTKYPAKNIIEKI